MVVSSLYVTPLLGETVTTDNNNSSHSFNLTDGTASYSISDLEEAEKVKIILHINF